MTVIEFDSSTCTGRVARLRRNGIATGASCVQYRDAGLTGPEAQA